MSPSNEFETDSSPSDRPPSVLSVSGLTQKLKWTLRDTFYDVWVAGEISNLTQPGSGHVYLTLNDSAAQLKSIIWRTDAESVTFPLQNGMEVICRGEIDVYPARGVYQLVIRFIEPKGLGAQQLALKKLHARLSSEGLFDADRKKPIPKYPKRIAIVTSPSGAAIQDFLQVVSRRWPNVEVLVIPARVQGDGAAVEIAQGVVVAGMLKHRPEVIVVSRGGGSAEDLWAFNDERLVRTIAASDIPVISGVGHEIDVTLCDLVADVRALTPSEAGELCVPVQDELVGRVADLQHRMSASLKQILARARQRLDSLTTRRVLVEPLELLNLPRRRVDELEMRLRSAGERTVERGHNSVALLAGRLNAVSPLNVLSRGYSVTETEDGTTLRSIEDVSKGDAMVTRLPNGRVVSRVELIEKAEDEAKL